VQGDLKALLQEFKAMAIEPLPPEIDGELFRFVRDSLGGCSPSLARIAFRLFVIIKTTLVL
jgi:hypothetical protein